MRFTHATSMAPQQGFRGANTLHSRAMKRAGGRVQTNTRRCLLALRSGCPKGNGPESPPSTIRPKGHPYPTYTRRSATSFRRRAATYQATCVPVDLHATPEFQRPASAKHEDPTPHTQHRAVLGAPVGS